MHSAFHSGTASITENVLILFAVVVWLGLGFRVHRDARRRIDDGRLVGLATTLGFALPYLGPVVYLLFRPPETLADAHGREVEMRALHSRLLHSAPHCPVCLSEVESDYLVCPVCTARLRQQCSNCAAALDPLWQACPYCATPVGGPLPIVRDLDEALTAETNRLVVGDFDRRGARG